MSDAPEYHWYGIDGINPEPWESPTGTIGRRNGKAFVMMSKSEKLRMYQEAIHDEFENQNPNYEMLQGEVEITFYFWRNVAQYETHTGRTAHANIADATNLQKATEDALQGILYPNDRAVRDVRSVIVSQDRDTEPFILISVCDKRPNGKYVELYRNHIRTEIRAAGGPFEGSRERDFGSAEPF